MEAHPNPSSRDAQPSFWIFEGRSALSFLGGFGASLAVFKKLADGGWDLFPNLLASLIPLAAVTLFVAFLVNGKSPSHPLDFLRWKLFQFQANRFRKGSLSRPPQLWHQPPKTAHPSTFN
jgi:hypothetical protein